MAITAAAVALSASASGASNDPVVQYQGQVIRQDIASQPGSEPDTVVEPDVAVSPRNPSFAIATAHDSRFPDGGAVDISIARTSDGGRTWTHKPVRGITVATGGPYERASDPVVAFGPDGTAYLSVLVFDASSCPTGVAVLRSHDGGQTWSSPFYAHRSRTCDYSDDKNWIVVDNSPKSPHYGRVYQFWTAFISSADGDSVGAPQAVRWSDDKAATWSNTHYVTPIDHGTQDSQPMITATGSIVDTYYDFGAGNEVPDVVTGGSPSHPRDDVRRPGVRRDALSPGAAIDAGGSIYASTSTTGGTSWRPQVEVVNNAFGYADGVRCCLFAADIDPVTHVMYAAYEGGVGATDPVYVVFSSDGDEWSSPIRVSRGDVTGVQRVNVDVVARAGKVYVDYGTRTHAGAHGGFVQQQLSVSFDGGYSFGPPISFGPRSALQYSAEAEGHFPGDYIGEALAPGRLYAVWAVSSPPPGYSTSRYHQVLWGTTFRL